MLAQQVANGLMLGSVYALIGIGYTLVFGVLRSAGSRSAREPCTGRTPDIEITPELTLFWEDYTTILTAVMAGDKDRADALCRGHSICSGVNYSAILRNRAGGTGGPAADNVVGAARGIGGAIPFGVRMARPGLAL